MKQKVQKQTKRSSSKGRTLSSKFWGVLMPNGVVQTKGITSRQSARDLSRSTKGSRVVSISLT